MVFVATCEQQDNRYQIRYDLEEKLQLYLRKFKDKRLSVNIKRFYKVHTSKQKGYFFGFVLPLTTALMSYKIHERDHVYNMLKLMYLKETDEKGNEYIRSLSWDSEDPVDTKLMGWFIEQIRDMVNMQFGYFIPDANKYHKHDINELVRMIEEE